MVRLATALAMTLWAGIASAQFYGNQLNMGRVSGDERTDQQDAEMPVKLPAAPAESALIPFFVSAASPHKFMVDANSLSVEKDGVVRYVLVIQTAGGARNVSYEGMRCATAERRTYAYGKSDGGWSPARAGTWNKIREAEVNRQYAALFQDYFCPGGVVVASADEARRLLHMGGEKQGGTPGR